MPVFNNMLAGASGAGEADAFEVSKSLRFNPGDSAYLSKTFSSSGNRKTFTWSGWVKRSADGNEQILFARYTANSDAGFESLYFNTSDKLVHTGWHSVYFISEQVFRDPSAWFHVVWVVNVIEATGTNRNKVYINGALISDYATYNNLAQNTDRSINEAALHSIGARTGGLYLNGYLAEVNFIDGQALAPTDFGEFDDNGVWQAKEFTGAHNAAASGLGGVTVSSYVSGPVNSTKPLSNCFGGTIGSGYQNGTTATSGNALTLDISSLNATVTNVRLNTFIGGSPATLTINGSNVSYSGSGDQTQVVAVNGQLNTIVWGYTNGSNYVYMRGIEVDFDDGNGYQLLADGAGSPAGVNGFRLPFTDNSTTQALGYDAAVTAPTLNPKGGMDVVTYTGNGGTQSISSLTFQPDFVWIKAREASVNHILWDTQRGSPGNYERLESSSTATSSGNANLGLTAFNSNGFTVVDNSAGGYQVNGAAGGTYSGTNGKYVAWCWKAGGAAVSNTDGTITSQVSASTDYGFSIVSYVSNSSAVQTVGHGLSTAPKFIIWKDRDAATNWFVYHNAGTAYMFEGLNTNSAGSTTINNINNTLPSSSVFTLNSGGYTINANGNHNLIAYCWSEVAGFSKFGSYTGTGAAGVSVTTGFKPRWVMIKETSNANQWYIYDTQRGATNILWANSSNSESTIGSGDGTNQNAIEVSDTGFSIPHTLSGTNRNGGTFIYAAFADRPGNNWTPNNLVAAGITGGKLYKSSTLYTTKSDVIANATLIGSGAALSSEYLYYVPSGSEPSGAKVFSLAGVETATGTIDFYYYSGSSWSHVNGSYYDEEIVDFNFGASDASIFTLQSNRDFYVIGSNLGGSSPAAYSGTGPGINLGGENIDSLVDSPSNGTQDDTGIGGEVVGNYCTPNPLNTNSNVGFSDGNLNLNSTAGGWYSCYSTMGISSGKFYWEATAENNSSSALNSLRIGIAPASSNILNSYIGSISDGYGYSQSNGNKYNNGSGSSYGSSLSVGDIVMVAFDADNGKIWWGKNGTWFASGNPASGTNAAFTSIPSNTYVPAFSFDRGRWIVNMGARAFAYAAPSGYKSLNTANLPTPTIADGSLYFDTKLWTGDDTDNRDIGSLSFSPDLVWIKSRTSMPDGYNYSHTIYSTVQGPTKNLRPNETVAEITNEQGGYINQFNSNGFRVTGGSANHYYVNENNEPYVGWAWDAGNSNTTIAVGDLNSSVYNQSQTWSNSLTSSNGFWSGQGATKAFDGTGSSVTGTNNGGTLTLSLSLSIPANSTIEVRPSTQSGGYTVVVNGVSNSITGDSFHTVNYDGATTLTSITVASAGSSSADLKGIKINGALLTDTGVTPPTTFPTIASTVRANPSAGFSIVGYTGNNTAGASIGHGLNAAPEFIVCKDRDSSSGWWAVYSASQGNTKGAYLNSTQAFGTQSFWNNTTPTSSVFSVGANANTNASGNDYLALCFAPVEGYSAMGSYTGNGSSDGPFVALSFAPAFVMFKRSDSTGDWIIFDNKRNTHEGNYREKVLYPNKSNTEETSANGDTMLFLSNGFKLNNVTFAYWNASGGTYVYLAFASNPFQANGGLAR